MENLIKGWITSVIGLAGVLITILHYFGIVKLPNPAALSNTWESVIAAILSLGFFMMPYTKIESAVESAWGSLLKLFNKKVDGDGPKY